MAKKIKIKELLPNRKTLEKELDKAWSVLVKKKWTSRVGAGRCAIPGCKNLGRDPHHIFTRKGRSTRWDVKNGIVLCAWHHRLGVPSAHNLPIDNPTWFNGILNLYYTQSELDYLAYKAHSNAKFSRGDLFVMLTEMMGEMEGKNEENVNSVGSNGNKRKREISDKDIPF